ncbi:hypothetical protein CVIRNUC_001064 [Coccomyxa viridis]|uniref:Secreted protein n=1 Tax=Coccomyxa viridis TaxID=1274662 RepID=A0AAV1HUZ7_9CHLO|nr:hypothetical protein CVIRNUC_001064 [Coccomyxa viridis]
MLCYSLYLYLPLYAAASTCSCSSYMQAEQLSMFLAQPAGAAMGASCTSTFLELANARNLPRPCIQGSPDNLVLISTVHMMSMQHANQSVYYIVLCSCCTLQGIWMPAVCSSSSAPAAGSFM